MFCLYHFFLKYIIIKNYLPRYRPLKLYGMLNFGVICAEIEEANWLTLPEDISGSGRFDAVICLGNSFAHLPDEDPDHVAHRYTDSFPFLTRT